MNLLIFFIIDFLYNYYYLFHIIFYNIIMIFNSLKLLFLYMNFHIYFNFSINKIVLLTIKFIIKK